MSEKVVISGASGDLGRRVTALLQQEPGVELTLVTRTPERLAQKQAKGITVRRGDYSEPESLDTAFAGGDVLFLISGLNLGRRVPEHRNAIAAAKRAGIRHIVYTSVGGVQSGNPALSAKDHYQSELDLRESGLAYTFLRNHLYAEIVSNIWIAPAATTGRLELAAGRGSLSPIGKEDIARSAAAVLRASEHHAGAVYDITGPELLTVAEIAKIGSDVYGVPIEYVPVTAEERLAYFDSVGIPRTYDPSMALSTDGHMWASDELVTADVSQAEDFQAILTHHVKQITGRMPESLRSVMERVKSVRYDQIGAVAQ
ncbi:SDR family oxidoreductase [Paraburkholderia dipogonis]|uniref:SDR family oxidoreductase n=1 Tax=Paraburkholderia dipogonis TaxID=1211383 RepID=A0A4Y8ML04_9BURK|nr:SDR family oxidoreductase [Paraburkholderia dipogonis]TFE38088.1 SDR family oxidoreductase [Paraburkholderia dipogonis]